jgi:hypothetical protein
MDQAILAAPTGPAGNLYSHFLTDFTQHERQFGGLEPWPFLRCVRVQ